MKKIFEIDMPLGKAEVSLFVATYAYNGQMYIGLDRHTEDSVDHLCELTAYVPGISPTTGVTFLNPDVEKHMDALVREHALGTVLPIRMNKNSRTYSIVVFNMERLSEYDPEGVRNYLEHAGKKEPGEPEEEKEVSTVKGYHNYILAYYPDKKRWAATEKRGGFYEFPEKFPDESLAVAFFEKNAGMFLYRENEILKGFGEGPADAVSLLNTGKEYDVSILSREKETRKEPHFHTGLINDAMASAFRRCPDLQQGLKEAMEALEYPLEYFFQIEAEYRLTECYGDEVTPHDIQEVAERLGKSSTYIDNDVADNIVEKYWENRPSRNRAAL